MVCFEINKFNIYLHNYIEKNLTSILYCFVSNCLRQHELMPLVERDPLAETVHSRFDDDNLEKKNKKNQHTTNQNQHMKARDELERWMWNPSWEGR